MKLEELDVEQLVSYLGCTYKISNGTNGLQINIKECPNCGRSDYKVYINADTGLGNCFVCSVGFNRYKLIKLVNRFSNHVDVARYVETISSTVRYRPKLDPEAYHLNNDWKLPLNKKIETEDDIPVYLKERNLDAKLCRRFDLRHCKYGFYKYNDFSNSTRFVDFSNRIIIPVRDIEGNLVTFQGRDLLGTSNKRYLFPNMLPGTGRYIYNANYAFTNKSKRVILNEGCFDVFATTRALESDIAFKEFVACGTFGKHLSMTNSNVTSTDQLSDLVKLSEGGVEEFVVLWDGEPEAIKAAIETALALNNYGLYTTIATLTNGLDPDEVGSDVILKAIENRFKPNKLDLMRYRLYEHL